MAMLFAATYPERVDKLVLGNTTARFARLDPEYPIGASTELMTASRDLLVEHWATPQSLMAPMFQPSMVGDEVYRRWLVGYERACASPGAVRDIWDWITRIDVRDVLGSIQCPTLVLHVDDDQMVPIGHARYLADHIPDVALVTVPGTDHTAWTNASAAEYVGAAEEFLTGHRRADVSSDRVLATVLFTDIVGSTEHLGRVGDREWRTLLDRHDRVTREQIARFGGHEIQFTGDGFVVTFDMPSRAVRAAEAIVQAVRPLGIEVRAGLHTGEIERRGANVAGLAVHAAARIGALAGPSQVLTSTTVRDLALGSEFTFSDAGEHHLKGITGDWKLLQVA